MDYQTTYFFLACTLGLFMAWGVGANDVANAMGTSVGSKAITLKQAIIIATIFEFAGTTLAGGQVAATIRGGLIDPNLFANTPTVLINGMLASLASAGTWLLVASRLGWPVSTTHSIVGAIVGFGAVCVGVQAVAWGQVTSIVLSWIITPFIAGVIAFILLSSVQRFIINTEEPLENAKRYVPIYMFLAVMVTALVTLTKGVHHLGLHLTPIQSFDFSVLLSLLVTLLGTLLIRRIKFKASDNRDFHYTNVEKVFGVLMIFTACAMAFAHGSNDVANAIGPLAAVVSIIQNGGSVSQSATIPYWILLLGGVGIVAGLVMYGYKVIDTIGSNITELTPSRGFAATLSAAATVVVASGTGLPVSTTQTLVGAILGVGFARGIGALDLTVIRNIFMSWVITLPAGAILSIVFYYLLHGIFH